MNGKVVYPSLLRGMSPQVLVAYGVFTGIAASSWYFVANGEFSAILTMAEMLQCFALITLAMQVLSSSSAAGISARSLALEAAALCCRLSSTTWLNGYLPVDASGDWLYQAVDMCAVLVVVWLLHEVLVTRRSTYQADDDTFGVHEMVFLAVLLAALLHADMNDFPVFDTLWMAGLFLGVVAVLPQLWLITRTGGKVEALTSHYIAMMAVGRVLSGTFMWHAREDITCAHWIDGVNHAVWAILAAHLIHLIKGKNDRDRGWSKDWGRDRSDWKDWGRDSKSKGQGRDSRDSRDSWNSGSRSGSKGSSKGRTSAYQALPAPSRDRARDSTPWDSRNSRREPARVPVREPVRLRSPPARRPEARGPPAGSYSSRSYGNGRSTSQSDNRAGTGSSYFRPESRTESRPAGADRGSDRGSAGYRTDTSQRFSAFGRSSAPSSRSAPLKREPDRRADGGHHEAAKRPRVFEPQRGVTRPAATGRVAAPARPRPEPPRANGRLPHPWEEHFSDEYNLTYYWNSKTGASSWERPTH